MVDSVQQEVIDMLLKFTTQAIKERAKVLNPVKYQKLHENMFKYAEEYVSEIYPDYEITGLKLVCKVKENDE